VESQSILVKVEIDDLGTNTLLSLALLLFCCGAFMSVDPGFRLSVPPVVDAFDFARRGQVVEGAFSIHRLQRLLDGLEEQPLGEVTELSTGSLVPGVVRYVIQGRRTKDDVSQLVMRVQANLVLECQRCLGVLTLPIDRTTVFELVRRESDLSDDEPDEEDFEAPEQIVGSPKFDLCELLEDELILEVPYVPRHTQCPEMADLDAQADEVASREEPPSPFAVLGQLKKGK
jgi:uncharacterized protein